LVWGSFSDSASSIALDSSGHAYVCGIANSNDFPTLNPFQANLAGLNNSFVSKLQVEAAVNPPGSAKGKKTANRFLFQTDYINIVTWSAPADGPSPVMYKIYRDAGLTKLAATVQATQKLQFKDHNRIKDKAYTYYIVSVDGGGNFSEPAVVEIS